MIISKLMNEVDFLHDEKSALQSPENADKRGFLSRKQLPQQPEIETLRLGDPRLPETHTDNLTKRQL